MNVADAIAYDEALTIVVYALLVIAPLTCTILILTIIKAVRQWKREPGFRWHDHK